MSKENNNGKHFFCINRCGWQKLTKEGTCPICGVRIKREPTNQSIKKRLILVYEENKDLIDSSLILQLDKRDLKIPIQLGFAGTYFVPLKHIIQFANIERADPDQIGVFIEYLKSHCKKLVV